jgi:hypothetical protein
MRKHILFGLREVTVFKVDVNYVSVPGQVGLGGCCEHSFERSGEFVTLNEDSLGVINEEGHGKVGVKFRSGKCDKIINTKAIGTRINKNI